MDERTDLEKLKMESFFTPYFLHRCPSSYGAYLSDVQVFDRTSAHHETNSGKFRGGGNVTPGPIWNLAHSDPCECYEIL
jgi:hypothetical protein